MQDNVRVYAVILLKVDHTLSLSSGPLSVVTFRPSRLLQVGEVRCLVQADGSRGSHAFI